MNKTIFLIAGAICVLGVGGAYANGFFGTQTPVEFYKGHTHGPNMEAIGAPAHSGGTDAEGCHNASVPRHCH